MSGGNSEDQAHREFEPALFCQGRGMRVVLPSGSP